jgi:hypothetical protein
MSQERDNTFFPLDRLRFDPVALEPEWTIRMLPREDVAWRIAARDTEWLAETRTTWCFKTYCLVTGPPTFSRIQKNPEWDQLSAFSPV